MKNLIIITILLVSQITLLAQNGTTRYEAENATLSNAVSENWRMTNPSGGAYAYTSTVGATMTFTVNASSAGSYNFDIAYANAGTPSFKVIVNGSSTTLTPATSGGQDVTATTSYTASLNSGSNTVVIEHVDGWTCYDYIDVTGVTGGTCTSQSITFGSLAAKTVGDAAFSLTAIASSGLGVSYVSSNQSVATVSGSTVTIVAAGTTTITASQAGDATYCAASNVDQVLTVNAAGGGSMTVWDKLQKGINEDASIPTAANFEKVIHEAGYMQTIADAGFNSVRLYIPYSADFTAYQQRIQDALDNNLAVILCMWGPSNWYNNNQATTQIADRWTSIAQWVENTWPGEEDIVFELLNETGGIGFPQTVDGYNQAMKLYGAAANAVRTVSSTRPILISPPGWQDADKMSYVSQNKMGYDFANDNNVGISIHFYEPNNSVDGWFAMNEYPLNNPASGNWKQTIIDEIDYVLNWRTSNNVPNMPIVVTEWGFWTFPEREANGDAALVAQFEAQYFRDHGICGTWYTGIQYNQRAFAIFDSETGWNKIVTEAITQQPVPTSWPATNQFLGSEFEDRQSKTWKLYAGGSQDYVQSNEALSGNTSVRLSAGDIIYQRTFVGAVSANLEVSENIEPRLGKYLLHLIQGKTYKISFMAKAEGGTATMKFRMKENQSYADGSTIVNKTGITYYTSDPITISQTANTYEFSYTYTAATEMDMWFEFEVVSGTVIFDKPDLRQVAPGGVTYSAVVSTNIQKNQQSVEEIRVYPNLAPTPYY